MHWPLQFRLPFCPSLQGYPEIATDQSTENLTPSITATYRKSGTLFRHLIFRNILCVRNLHFTPHLSPSSHIQDNTSHSLPVKHNRLFHNHLQKIRYPFGIPDFSQQPLCQELAFHSTPITIIPIQDNTTHSQPVKHNNLYHNHLQKIRYPLEKQSLSSRT